MTNIDFSPLYRTTVDFDQLASVLHSNLLGERSNTSYPPYDIEIVKENEYRITLALAGFNKTTLDIQVDNNVLSIRGKKTKDSESPTFLHRGIENRAFERKFDLADHVKVVKAEINDGLLSIELMQETPETMKPKSIPIH